MNLRAIPSTRPSTHERVQSMLAGLGHERLRVATLQPVALPVRSAVRLVACGAEHTLVATDGGALLGCGSNAFGQLSLGDHVRSRSSLERVPLPDEVASITDIAC